MPLGVVGPQEGESPHCKQGLGPWAGALAARQRPGQDVLGGSVPQLEEAACVGRGWVGASTMRSQGSLMRLAWSSRLLYSSSSHSRCRVLSGSLSCTGIDTFDRSLPMLLRSMFHRLTSAPGPLAAGRQRRRGGPADLPATHTPGVPRSRHHSLASRRGRPAGWPTARLPPTPSPSLHALMGRTAGNLILDKLPGVGSGKTPYPRSPL